MEYKVQLHYRDEIRTFFYNWSTFAGLLETIKLLENDFNGILSYKDEAGNVNVFNTDLEMIVVLRRFGNQPIEIFAQERKEEPKKWSFPDIINTIFTWVSKPNWASMLITVLMLVACCSILYLVHSYLQPFISGEKQGPVDVKIVESLCILLGIMLAFGLVGFYMENNNNIVALRSDARIFQEFAFPQALRQEIHQNSEKMRQEIHQNSEKMRQEIHQNSEQMRQEIHQNSEQMQQIRQAIQEIKQITEAIQLK